MDEGTERPGRFARGGVGRFLLGLAVATIVFFVVTCCCSNALGMVLGFGYFASHDDELEAAKSEGTVFASGHTVSECVTEAQARGAARCTWLSPACGIFVGNFASACVAGATDDDYCASVPGPTGGDPNLDATMEWQRAACANISGLWCGSVMREVQSACWERQRKETSGGAETADAPDFEAAGRDGHAFAHGRTTTECVVEVQRRGTEQCTDAAPMCGVPLAEFARQCIAFANDDGYCTKVPASTEFAASTQWQKTVCATVPGTWCDSVMGGVQRGCEAGNVNP